MNTNDKSNPLPQSGSPLVQGARSWIRHTEFRDKLKSMLNAAEWDDYNACEVDCNAGVATSQQRDRRDSYERLTLLSKW